MNKVPDGFTEESWAAWLGLDLKKVIPVKQKWAKDPTAKPLVKRNKENPVCQSKPGKDGLKVCSKCKCEKSLDSFHVCRQAKDGRLSRCKDCQNQQVVNCRQESKDVKTSGLPPLCYCGGDMLRDPHSQAWRYCSERCRQLDHASVMHHLLSDYEKCIGGINSRGSRVMKGSLV